MKPNLDQKHGWQAKRSLDNELYRNVELEVWEESKNGNVCIAGIAHRLPTKKSLVLCQFVINVSFLTFSPPLQTLSGNPLENLITLHAF